MNKHGVVTLETGGGSKQFMKLAKTNGTIATRAEADNEAKRLAEATGKNHYVVEIVSAFGRVKKVEELSLEDSQ